MVPPNHLRSTGPSDQAYKQIPKTRRKLQHPFLTSRRRNVPITGWRTTQGHHAHGSMEERGVQTLSQGIHHTRENGSILAPRQLFHAQQDAERARRRFLIRHRPFYWGLDPTPYPTPYPRYAAQPRGIGSSQLNWAETDQDRTLSHVLSPQRNQENTTHRILHYILGTQFTHRILHCILGTQLNREGSAQLNRAETDRDRTPSHVLSPQLNQENIKADRRNDRVANGEDCDGPSQRPGENASREKGGITRRLFVTANGTVASSGLGGNRPWGGRRCFNTGSLPLTPIHAFSVRLEFNIH